MKRSLLIAALLCAAGAALAQTVTVTPREDRGEQPMIGARNIGRAAADEAACLAALTAQVRADKKTQLGKCRGEKVFLFTYSEAPPPVTCPSPPAPSAAVLACPLPLVGQWSQTTTVSIGAAPTCTRTVVLSPAAPPAGSCTQPPTTPPPTGAAVYLSDCQAGASVGCVAGDNAAPGTQARPKRTLAGLDPNTLAAGTRILFARGGAWANFAPAIYNRNSTPAAPLVFDAYGAGPMPLLAGGFGFATQQGQTATHGGYVLRNLRLVGRGGDIGVRASKATTGLTLDTVELSGFGIAVLLDDNTVGGLTVRNSYIHDIQQHGILGAGDDWTIVDSIFERVGDARPPSTHAIYFGSGSRATRNLTVRGNVFRNNGQQGGACRSGNLTVHGQIDGALIEGNAFSSTTYGAGCRSISIVAGYGTAEYMRRFVIRNNQILNAAGIAWSAAPGIVVENNAITDTTGQAWRLIERVGNDSGGRDDADGGEVLRNNATCQRQDCPR